MKPHVETDDQNSETACLLLYFIDEEGKYYKAKYCFEPYFYLLVKPEII